ncbi:CBS domain-containing protein [Blastococcus sp. TML/M2B]|uniref:CBS domain-containing protein n=1 Tax=unclassified Blastococcus TaxID=2619396 RepID=UPI00190C2FBD|nr:MULTISPECIES: CBS domain-containing protein [unclassified Blastococcus]MBN1092875.1 CBS domain-containing protein [Blastococcus sp. TML/M2B]MBN1097017.1 CBS domain-containing protein [Blastococcus sp. TML/C7B]
MRGTDELPAVLRVMAGSRADAVPVVDRAGRLRGLVTLWHLAELAAGVDRAGSVVGG